MNKLITFTFFIFFSRITFANSKIGIQALSSSPETIFFIFFIIVLTLYFLFFRFNRFAVNHGPEILTTLGILGCFYGIAKALLYFNSSDLSNSIPLLLEGIKTAFCASLFGVGGALAIKFKHLLMKKPIPQPAGSAKAANMDDLINSISALQKSLAGNEEGTLLTQIKMLRQDSNDQLHNLRDAFEKFAAHMIENNQKAIIEVLKQVISDFNNNLTEQFGENFKQLNQSVERLVIWQQQYKEELEAIKQSQLQTAYSMQIASESFKILVSKAEDFYSIAEKLSVLLEAISRQKDILFEQEKALSELLIQMKDITPEFANKLSTMLNELTFGIKAIQAETVDILKNFGAQTQLANAEMKNLLTDMISKSQQQLSEGLQENFEIIKKGVLALDKALQKELNDSLTSLGLQLSSLSEKFVKDYSPLTDRLREVVRLAGNM